MISHFLQSFYVICPVKETTIAHYILTSLVVRKYGMSFDWECQPFCYIGLLTLVLG